MKNLLTALLLGAALAASAQTAPAFTSTCDDHSYSSGSSKRYCETRDLTLPSPGAQTLTIDGRANGGISVKGWNGNRVLVRTKVMAWAKSDEEARQLAKAVTISTKGNTLRADGANKSEQGWSVSYEVFVPRKTALALNTVNGGISLSNLDSSIKFDAVNGGISLNNVAGKVKGNTVNGGVSITLTGTKWEGEGLDVTTTNCGITWNLPKSYSARLYTSTNLGSIKAASLPITKQGMMHKEIATNLGRGGAQVRAVTTNGGIKVNQAAD